MRRTAFALLASLGLHATLLAWAVRLPSALAAAPPNIYLVPFTLEEVKELPLGPPPTAHKARAQAHRGFNAQRVVQRNAGNSVGGMQAVARDAQAPAAAAEPAAALTAADGAGTKRRGDVRASGPEGSRLVAILRLDRLRASPDARAYIAVVDDVLRLVPDRQRLLDATELDLYRDFDALLIATPNPFDDTVTFLAARHRLEDEAVRAALDRGAKAGGRAIEWRQELGRYVGVRKSPGVGVAPERDKRLFLLPAPGVVVMTPPAYAKLLLDGTTVPDSGVVAPDSVAGGRRDSKWTGFVTRIDAEAGAIPEDAVFVLTATNLLRSSSGTVVPGTRGEIDDALRTPRGSAMPNVISIMIGTMSTPFLEIGAEFDDEHEARTWEAEWPAWKQNLLGNPLVLLAGLDPLVSRAKLQRDGRTVVLRTTARSEEIWRLLRMIASFAPSGGAPGARP
jgi:hypothetical protein